MQFLFPYFLSKCEIYAQVQNKIKSGLIMIEFVSEMR